MAKVSSTLHLGAHSLSRPAVQFGRCGQVFPLSWSASAPSSQAPPLILLQLPLTDQRNESVCLSSSGAMEAFFAAL